MRRARDILSGYVGRWHHEGFEVSELDHDRGEIFVWDMNGILEPEFIDCPLTFLEDRVVTCIPDPCYLLFVIFLLLPVINKFAGGLITILRTVLETSRLAESSMSHPHNDGGNTYRKS